MVVVPTVSSVMSTPSTWMRVDRPDRPPIETPTIWFFVGSKLPPSTVWTPGSCVARSRKLRPLSGRRSICEEVISPCTLDCEVSTVRALSFTSTMLDTWPSSSFGEMEVVTPTTMVTMVAKVLKPSF